MSEWLEFFTIYERPRDYPQGFVIRRSVVAAGAILVDTEAVYTPTLDAARAAVPAGLHCLVRQPEDDPVIVEVWM